MGRRAVGSGPPEGDLRHRGARRALGPRRGRRPRGARDPAPADAARAGGRALHGPVRRARRAAPRAPHARPGRRQRGELPHPRPPHRGLRVRPGLHRELGALRGGRRRPPPPPAQGRRADAGRAGPPRRVRPPRRRPGPGRPAPAARAPHGGLRRPDALRRASRGRAGAVHRGPQDGRALRPRDAPVAHRAPRRPAAGRRRLTSARGAATDDDVVDERMVAKAAAAVADDGVRPGSPSAPSAATP
jgi:hypothetical protein